MNSSGGLTQIRGVLTTVGRGSGGVTDPRGLRGARAYPRPRIPIGSQRRKRRHFGFPRELDHASTLGQSAMRWKRARRQRATQDLVYVVKAGGSSNLKRQSSRLCS